MANATHCPKHRPTAITAGIAIAGTTSAGTRTYAYDDAKRITAITDTGNSARSWTYGYDLGDRLTAASSTGTTRGWTYDLNGNRKTETGSAPSTYTVATTNNRVTAITGSLARTYAYDNAGNVTSRGGATLTYNNAGRLASVTQGGNTATYVYNALGERVKRTDSAGTTLYVYDEDGALVGEYTGTGGLIQETVWLDDIPVATLRPNGGGVDVFYVHSDHLNTPRIVTRPSDNAVRWRWDNDPFGTTAANENPGGVGTFVCNLRFPGQQYDSVAGLSYNYFRDYDAATGSYAQSDPIGLDGGLVSTYAYAAGAPNLYDDSDGLVVPAMAMPAVMAVGRCFGQCVAFATAAEAIDYGADCVNGPGILKNCGIECMNPLNYIGVGKILKAGKSRSNRPSPLPKAEGPHTIIERPGPAGQYTTHNGDGTYKQYRGSGQDHGGIPRPNVKENVRNTAPDGRSYPGPASVRPPRPDEIPR